MKGIIKWVKGEDNIETSRNGGKHSKLHYRCDLLPFKALLGMSNVLKEGSEKYGDFNWQRVSRQEHLNHALTHLFQYMVGERSTSHLSHAITRLCFALEVHDEPIYATGKTHFDDFVNHRCLIRKGTETTEYDLYKAYLEFCDYLKTVPLPRVVFIKRLIKVGCPHYENAKKPYFKNIGL